MLNFMKFAVFTNARAVKYDSGVIFFFLTKRSLSLLSQVIQQGQIYLQSTTLLVSFDIPENSTLFCLAESFLAPKKIYKFNSLKI